MLPPSSAVLCWTLYTDSGQRALEHSMKTIVPPWTLAMVALLAAQTVVGFGIFDVLRESRQIKDSRRDVMAPADVLVHVVLEELDMNDDQQITLGDIGRYFVLLRDEESGRSRYEEAKGYIITIAVILDADQSGIVELGELQRAATILVNNTGTDHVGEFIDKQATIRYRTNRLDPVVKAGEIAEDFLAALDTDNDGLVSTEERDKLLTSRRLRRTRTRVMMNDADQNNDGNLDQSETGQLLKTMVAERHISFRWCYVYTRIWKLAGARIADKWLNPY